MRLILICTAVYAVAAGRCELNALSMPDNADSWSCNKPVDDGTVENYTRCKIVCLEGYDIWKGKRRDFHRCKRNGYWQTTRNVVLACKPNGKLRFLTKCTVNLNSLCYSNADAVY